MARTPLLEKPSSIRAMGAAFIALLLFFIWLTLAFFNKSFTEYVPVTLTTSNAGTALPSNADVKIRGMIVGEVRKIESGADGVTLHLGMKPDLIKEVPRDVTAQLVPKTLFGEKYVSLIPAEKPSGETLQAGDNIARASVPIEVETLLNDLYPLLEAVQPAELSYTLTAVADALEGRGEKLGDSLVTANDYLAKINPEVPQLIDDVVKLGKVSDVYAGALPDLGRLLKNLVVTGDTVVAKQAQLQAFFNEGTKLGDTATAFVKENGDSIITLNKEVRPVAKVISDYSIVFPCVLESVSDITPKLNSAFRGQALHIKLTVLGQQPTGYAANEHGTVPSKAEIDAEPLAKPDCHSLPNSPYTHTNKAPTPPFEIYELLGVRDDDGNPKTPAHNKFNEQGSKEFGSNRAAVSDSDLIDLVQPSIAGIDSASQRDQLNTLLGASLGMKSADVPDIGSLLVSPIIRGTEVSVSEAR